MGDKRVFCHEGAGTLAADTYYRILGALAQGTITRRPGGGYNKALTALSEADQAQILVTLAVAPYRLSRELYFLPTTKSREPHDCSHTRGSDDATDRSKVGLRRN